MEKLFKRCGFEVISIETPGRLDWDIVEGRMRRDGASIDRIWERISELDDAAKEDFQKWIVRNKLSSHMRIIAKRI